MNAFKRITAVSALIIGSAAALSAAVYTTNGTNGNWTDTLVWTGGTVPTTSAVVGDSMYLVNASTLTVNTTAALKPRLTIGSITSSGALVVTTNANMAITNRIYVGDRNTGTLTIEGGTLQAKGSSGNNIFNVANTAANYTARGQLSVSGDGRILFNGNLLTFSTGVNTDKENSSALATISQTGGTIAGQAFLQVSNNVTVTDGYSLSSQISLLGGTFSLSGSTTASNAFGNNSLTTNNAHVDLTVSSNMDTAYLGNVTNFSGSDTSLILLLEQRASRASWADKKVIEFGGALTIEGAAGVIVDLSDFGVWDSATVGQSVTVTLATYESLTKTSTTADTITGLDTSRFSASDITWGANAATITLTYIPEPAVAMGLLGVFALVFAVRRHRR